MIQTPSVRPGRIVCVGDVMVDVIARLPGELAIGSDRPAPIRIQGGGSGANTASWIARTGASVTLAGRIGRDSVGAQTADELRSGGVDTALAVDVDRSTGCCIVLVAPHGERTMVPDTGANESLRAGDLPGELFASDRHLHLSGYTLLGAARSAGLHALATARACGMSISIDAASAAPIASVGGAAFMAWVGRDVLLLANADEARVLTGVDDPAAAARQLAGQVGRAVVKLGSQGALWSDGQLLVVGPTRPVEVVDTTGAGDAFAAGLLVALGRGASPADALAAANALAAKACVVVGGRCPVGGRSRR